jgi:hypothetical protein
MLLLFRPVVSIATGSGAPEHRSSGRTILVQAV